MASETMGESIAKRKKGDLLKFYYEKAYDIDWKYFRASALDRGIGLRDDSPR